jgi:putative ABC transport system permease protein
MSLLALLVGFFLIYSAVSFAVVQRRALIGVLRALGATRRAVLATLLGEAALIGTVGAVLGVLLGAVIGHALVRLVAGTINDLYFVVAVSRVTLPAGSFLKALAAGIGVALIAAAIPAMEAAGSSRSSALNAPSSKRAPSAASRWLLLASALLAPRALAIVAGSTRSLACRVRRAFSACCSRSRRSRLRRCARARVRGTSHRPREVPSRTWRSSDIAASLSRTGVAVAALSLAVCAMIGVALMVDSFRESLHDWLGRTLRADFT